MVCIDELLDYGSGLVDALLELVEVEMVGLGEVFELPPLLGFDDGGRAGAEAAVVDPGDVLVVVGKFSGDFGGGDEIGGKFGFF